MLLVVWHLFTALSWRVATVTGWWAGLEGMGVGSGVMRGAAHHPSAHEDSCLISR